MSNSRFNVTVHLHPGSNGKVFPPELHEGVVEYGTDENNNFGIFVQPMGYAKMILKALYADGTWSKIECEIDQR